LAKNPAILGRMFDEQQKYCAHVHIKFAGPVHQTSNSDAQLSAECLMSGKTTAHTFTSNSLDQYRRVKLLGPTANAQADEACGIIAIGTFRRLTARLYGPKLCLSPQPHRVRHELRPPALATPARHLGTGRHPGRRLRHRYTRVARARSRTSQPALGVLILPADEVFGTHTRLTSDNPMALHLPSSTRRSNAPHVSSSVTPLS
jgi:hypothetical protein